MPTPAPASVRPIWEAAGQEGLSFSSAPPCGPWRRLGLGDRRLWAVGDAGELGDDAGGQHEGEAAHVLFAVTAGQAHLEGRVGAGLVVHGARLKAGVEGGGAGGAGAAVTPRSIVKVALRSTTSEGSG